MKSKRYIYLAISIVINIILLILFFRSPQKIYDYKDIIITNNIIKDSIKYNFIIKDSIEYEIIKRKKNITIIQEIYENEINYIDSVSIDDNIIIFARNLSKINND